MAELEWDDMDTLRANSRHRLVKSSRETWTTSPNSAPDIQSMVYELETLHGETSVESSAA